jgi:hypothetical protein
MSTTAAFFGGSGRGGNNCHHALALKARHLIEQEGVIGFDEVILM